MSTSSSQGQIDLRRLRQVCSECSVRDLCLPVGLNTEDLDELETLAEVRGPLREEEHLYRVGDPLRYLYAVRSGTFKTSFTDEHGREHVLGFHMPGELIGLDAVYPERHQCEALALETATVCRFNYDHLTDIAGRLPALQRQLFRLASKDVSGMQAPTASNPAEERLAAFLLDWAARLKRRGYSATHFVLSMPRRDLANYLAVAPETISRLLRRFQDEGLIRIEGREVWLLNTDGLREA